MGRGQTPFGNNPILQALHGNSSLEIASNPLADNPYAPGRLEHYELKPEFTETGLRLRGLVYREDLSEVHSVGGSPKFEIPYERLPELSAALEELQDKQFVKFPERNYSADGFDLVHKDGELMITFAAVYEGGFDPFRFHYLSGPAILKTEIDAALEQRG